MKVLHWDEIQDLYVEILVLGWKIKVVDDHWVLTTDNNVVWTLKDKWWEPKWPK